MTIIMVSHEFRYSTLRWLELASPPMFSDSLLDGLASFEQWTIEEAQMIVHSMVVGNVSVRVLARSILDVGHGPIDEGQHVLGGLLVEPAPRPANGDVYR